MKRPRNTRHSVLPGKRIPLAGVPCDSLIRHHASAVNSDSALHAPVDELLDAEETPATEHRHHRECFNFCPAGLLVTDIHGGILAVNAAAAFIFGEDSNGLIGGALVTFVAVPNAASLATLLRTLPPGGSAVTELSLRPAGQECSRVQLRAFRSSDSERIFWHISHAPRVHLGQPAAEAKIRELEQALYEKGEILRRESAGRAQAETACRAKDRFIAVLSHDLRSPLNAVLGWTTFMRREPLDEAERERALAIIERNARAQAELIEQLLALSRVAAGKLALDMHEVNLRTLVRESLEASQPAFSAKEIQIVDHTENVDGPIYGDSGRLRQVISNLMANALKFTPKGGRIEVNLETSHDEACLSISDDGEGIEAAKLPVLFDCFKQVGDAANQTGLGLGLFIVKQIVEQHGGRADVSSLGLGKGATFTISLPLRDARRAAPPSIAAPPSEKVVERGKEVDLRGLKVLVVEDDPDGSELLAFVLERRGARVTNAASAAGAFEAYRANAHHVVLSDLGLAGSSGHDLLQKIRAFEREAGRSRAPALAVSGFASKADVRRALAAGFDGHVSKPLVMTELLETLDRLTMDLGVRRNPEQWAERLSQP